MEICMEINMYKHCHHMYPFSKHRIIEIKFNIHTFPTQFVSFGTEQETSYHFFRSIGESESEDPTLTETSLLRLS